MNQKIIITALILVILAQYYQQQKKFNTSNPDSQQEVSEIVANLREENKDLETQLQQARQLEKFNSQQINRLQEQLKTYQQGEDWETKTGEIIKDLEKEVQDLTSERDEAIREQKTSEQEVLALNNRLKNKNQEVDNKEKSIQQFRQESQTTNNALRTNISELRKQLQASQEKYRQREKLLDEEQCENNKLTEQINQLETDYQQKLTDLNKEQSERKNLEAELEQTFQEKENLASKITELATEKEKEWKEYQQQLRTINLLFDPQAQYYETIDFNGLYTLLQQISQKEETNQLTQQKVNSLENQLLNLAKQKIKGKKEATELVKDLEIRLAEKESIWQSEKKELEATITKITQMNLELELVNKKSYATEQEIEKTMDSILKGMQDLNKELDK